MSNFIAQLKFAGFLTAIAGTAFSISLCGIGLGMYAVGLVMQLFWDPQADWRPFPHAKHLVLLVASLIISVFISHYWWDSARGFFKYAEGFALLYAGVDLIRTPKDLKLAVYTFFACYFIVGLAAVWQDAFGFDFIYFREPNKYTLDIFRLSGPFKHSNDFAAYLIPGIVLAAALAHSRVQRKSKRLTFIVCVVLMALLAYGMWRSMSRGALISVVVGLVVFALFFSWRKWVLAAIAAAMTAAWFIPSTFSGRLRELMDFTHGTIPERLYLLKGAFRMIEASPLFGLGLNTYSKWFPVYNPPDPEQPVLMYTHNSFIQMATEAGLVGLALYLLLIFTFLVWMTNATIRKTENCTYRLLAAGIIGSLAGLLANCMFESLMQSTQLRTLFWILMGMGSAIVVADFFRKSGETAR